MKRLTSLVAASLALAALISTAQAQQTLYWDRTDGALGFFTPGSFADGTWDNNITANWNLNSDGSGANIKWQDTNVPADNAVIDVAGASNLNGSGWVAEDAGITIAGARTTNTVTFGNAGGAFSWVVPQGSGNITAPGGVTVLSNTKLSLTGTPNFNAGYTGVIDTGTSTFLVGAGARVDSNNSARLNAAGTLKLDGGTFISTNPGSAGSIISGSKNLEVSANGGTVGYAPPGNPTGGTPNFSTFVSIYAPVAGAILGTGGTTTNGVGTLTVANVGNSELRVQNAGTANSTFAKLKVVSGMYRFGNVTGQNFETAAGAVPSSVLADAVTLDGGYLGSSWAVTFHANRGVTITSNGGGFDNGGGQNNPSAGAGTIVVPGPFSGPGEFTVKGISNTNGNRGGGITLSNAGNVTSFTGSLNVQGSTLTLNESLTATHLRGDHTLTIAPVAIVGTTPCGLISIAANKTLTFGSDNSSTAYDGQISGSGIVTKVGTGTISLNSFGGEWTNSGGTNINDGVLKYTTAAAGLTGPVTIGASGKLNMNGTNDTFASLSAPAGAIVDMKDAAATAGNLTLNAATPVSVTYSGTIVGGGNLTKSSSSTQKFAGNAALGTVALNGGFTLVNGSTMTATGGVTIGAAGSLGGTGIIAGSVSNSGVIAPGDGGIGTLSVTGNVTEAAASTLHIELLNATSDKLAVTGNLDLSAADTLSVTGTGTGSSWTIASYTGTLTGTFNTLSIPSGYTVDYGAGTNSVITLNAGVVGVPGDFNGDGKVDALDYVAIRKQYSDIITPGPGQVAYDAYRVNFGNPPGAGNGGTLSSGEVPEPATLVFAGLAMFFGLVVRRR